MAGERTRAFQVILVAAFCLSFFAGLCLFPAQNKRADRYNPEDFSNTIRLKRLEAIRKAVKTGKNTYEFIFESTEEGGRKLCVPR